MKKKVLNLLLAILLVIPCMFVFTACGELKSLSGKKLVFSKVEVTGTLVQEEVEYEYNTISFDFGEDTVLYSDGTNEDTYDYKVEDGKLYLKYSKDEYGTTPFAELSGKYLVMTETLEGGTVTVYFKVK